MHFTSNPEAMLRVLSGLGTSRTVHPPIVGVEGK